jgi:abhydrolase domain-containing protein 17
MFLKALIVLILSYLGLLLWAYLKSDSLIFLPQPSSYSDSSQILKLPVDDKTTIAAIYLANPAAKYTLLVSHGNFTDLGYMLPLLQALHDHGFAVFAYDYPGYGLSTGKPTEQGVYRAVTASYNYLTDVLKILPQNIIAYGISLGAAAAIDLASRKFVAGVIVQSPFVSAFRVETYIPLAPFDKFNNLVKITKINCPILIIHGTSDKIVSLWHGKKLCSAAREPKTCLWIEGADHNDLISVAGSKYWQGLERFVSKL